MVSQCVDYSGPEGMGLFFDTNCLETHEESQLIGQCWDDPEPVSSWRAKAYIRASFRKCDCWFHPALECFEPHMYEVEISDVHRQRVARVIREVPELASCRSVRLS